MRKLLLLAPLALALSGCGVLSTLTHSATIGTVQLDADKAFLTAQIALASAQQSTLVACSTGPLQGSATCHQAIELLHTGATAEAAGYAAIQVNNAPDLAAAIVDMVAIPSQLVALGILKGS